MSYFDAATTLHLKKNRYTTANNNNNKKRRIKTMNLVTSIIQMNVVL